MIDTRLWASTPFNNRTAWTDFLGMFDLWNAALADAVFAKNGNTYRTYPLGNGGSGPWLHAVQQQLGNAAGALGIAGPPDVESYDLSDAGDFASWTFVVGNYCRSLALAAGLN